MYLNTFSQSLFLIFFLRSPDWSFCLQTLFLFWANHFLKHQSKARNRNKSNHRGWTWFCRRFPFRLSHADIVTRGFRHSLDSVSAWQYRHGQNHLGVLPIYFLNLPCRGYVNKRVSLTFIFSLYINLKGVSKRNPNKNWENCCNPKKEILMFDGKR